MSGPFDSGGQLPLMLMSYEDLMMMMIFDTTFLHLHHHLVVVVFGSAAE